MYIYNVGTKGKITKTGDGEVIDFSNQARFEEVVSKNSELYRYYIDEEGQLVYKNWQKNFLVYREIFEDKACIVNEPNLPKINWEIKKETKKIGRFNCQKAIAEFRGRTYEAWFTLEIPVPTGPWKLHGLPGLILEAYDSDKEFQYFFQSIEAPLQDTSKLSMLPKTGKVISLKDYPMFCEEEAIARKRRVESKAAARGQTVIVTLSKLPNQEIKYE
jgi:GLPGLI family protein